MDLILFILKTHRKCLYTSTFGVKNNKKSYMVCFKNKNYRVNKRALNPIPTRKHM